MAGKKTPLPFDKRGGVLAISRNLLNSSAYLTLKPVDKVMIFLLHEQWKIDDPVSYGVREAAKKVPCNVNTASKGFNTLQERGFIECVEQSQFNSKNGSRARDWKLNWMPYLRAAPTNEWEKWSPLN